MYGGKPVEMVAPFWLTNFFEDMADKLQVSVEEVMLSALALGAVRMVMDGTDAFEEGVRFSEENGPAPKVNGRRVR